MAMLISTGPSQDPGSAGPGHTPPAAVHAEERGTGLLGVHETLAEVCFGV